jgi:ubiquitin conjugation factor E4 B
LDSFQQAVARDGRSYDPMTFARARNIVTKFNLMPQADLERFDQFTQAAQHFHKQEMEQDEILADVPDEFMDPILFTLMENPVRLPTSNVVMDLSSIKTHLLSDQTDPFNRKPLTMDMLVPEDDLKARIQEWRRQHTRI